MLRFVDRKGLLRIRMMGWIEGPGQGIRNRRAEKNDEREK
jgi:hypothetical protein